MGARDDQRRYAWRVLSVTSLGVLLAGANTSTLDTALPVVSRHFGASGSEAAWLLLSYMLVNTVLILSFGRAADIVGRRRLYLVGLGTLTAASFLCGLAPNIVTLDILRAVAGIGSAAIITNTTAQLTDAFPPDLLPIGLGLNVTVAAGSQVVGPLLGGFLATTFGWRGVFWFNVPTGVAGLAWAMASLRRSVDRPPREPFDVVGALLSFVALTGLVVAVSEAGTTGLASTPVSLGVLAFAVAGPLFVVVQARRRYPLVDLSLFRSRERSLAYLASFLLSMARFAIVLLVALYLQAAAGLNASQAGLRVVPVAVAMAVASPLAGRLARHHPARVLSSAGLAVTGLGLLALALLLAPDRSYWQIAVCLAAIGAGSGLFLTPNTSSIMRSVPAARRGVANGVRSTMQNTGYVLSTALSLAIVTSPLAPDEQRAAYAGSLSRLAPGQLDAFTNGYRVALLVLAALSAIGLAASLLRDPPRRPAAPSARAAERERSSVSA